VRNCSSRQHAIAQARPIICDSTPYENIKYISMQETDEQQCAQGDMQAVLDAAAALTSQVQSSTERIRHANASITSCIDAQLDKSQTPLDSAQCPVREYQASSLESLQQQRLQGVWQRVQQRVQQADNIKQQQQQNDKSKLTDAETKQKQKQQLLGAGAAAQASSSSSSSVACGTAWPPLHAACFQTGVVSQDCDVAIGYYQLTLRWGSWSINAVVVYDTNYSEEWKAPNTHACSAGCGLNQHCPWQPPKLAAPVCQGRLLFGSNQRYVVNICCVCRSKEQATPMRALMVAC
jgi:hypothetical protein